MVKMATRDSAVLPWLEENCKNNQLELKGIEIYEFYSTSCHFNHGYKTKVTYARMIFTYVWN